MSRRLRAVILTVVSLLAAACASSRQSDAPAGHDTAFEVQLDGKTEGFNAAFTAFFPNELSVHPGSTVNFKLPRFSGEPHTVTFGTIPDAAVKKLESLGPTATIATQEGAPELLKLVDVFSHNLPKGPPSPNQSSAQPCFLDSGDPPGDEGSPPAWKTGSAKACPKREQPAFDGKQSFYNSGLLVDDGDSFSMELSEDISPGTYRYICVVHRGGMTGKLTVADVDTDIPSAAEQTAKGRAELAAIAKALAPAVEQAGKATPENAAAGLAVPTVFNAFIAEFAPKDATIKVGGTMSWNVFFFHTIVSGASEEDITLFVKGPDGAPAFNPKVAPSNAPALPVAVQVFPPPDDGKPVTIDAGKWNGQGLFASGLIGSVPPVLATYKLTFTKAGTYEFRCQVHPDMKATVTVA